MKGYKQLAYRAKGEKRKGGGHKEQMRNNGFRGQSNRQLMDELQKEGWPEDKIMVSTWLIGLLLVQLERSLSAILV